MKLRYVGLILFLTLIGAIAALLFTPVASPWILAQVRARAPGFGCEVDFARASITPLRQMEFADLKFNCKQPALSAAGKIAEARVRYAIDFFPLRIRVAELELARADLVVEQGETATDPPAGKPAGASLTLDLERARIEKLNLDARARGMRLRLQGADADFTTQIAGVDLASRGHFDLGAGADVEAGANAAHLRGHGDWDIDLAGKTARRLGLDADVFADRARVDKQKLPDARIELRSQNPEARAHVFLGPELLADLKIKSEKEITGTLELTLAPALNKVFPNPLLKDNAGAKITTRFTTDGRRELRAETRAPGLKIGGRKVDLEFAQTTRKSDEGFESEAELRALNSEFGRWRVPLKLRAENNKYSAQVGAEREAKGSRALPADWQGAIKFDARLEGDVFNASLLVPRLKLAQLAPEDLRFDLRGSMKNQVLSIPRFNFVYARDLIRVRGEASLNLQTRDAQVATSTDFHLHDFFGLTGDADLPLTFSVARGEELTATGELRLTNLNLKKGAVRLEKINGAIPLREQIKFKHGTLAFAKLLNENPFERVDFNRVRPLLNSKRQLSIALIGWRERAYGPFNGFASLEQNVIAAHAFDLDLGAGKAYGEAFFNFNPRGLQLGFLGRLTELNLTEFLPKEFLKGQDVNSRDLSARAGLICNLNRATLEGRVDVTEIGGRQLSALLNVLDPNYADDKFNKIRNLLHIGFPTAVNAAFADGFMDLDVDLKILSLVKRESVHGVPLTDFISRATEPLVRAAQEGIIQ